jgi:pyruvate kinase
VAGLSAHMRRTKVLVTVGPATDSIDAMVKLLRSGADAFRLNFSHGSDTEHRTLLDRMHAASRLAHREAAIVADVQGPKLRIGDLSGHGVNLTTGQTWTLDHDLRAGDAHRVGIEIPQLESTAKPGDPVLLGDGSVELRVETASPDSIVTRVVNGGFVSGHAGLFLPRARLRASVFAEKDRHDAGIALEGGIDFLAISFVRNAEDLGEVRRWLDRWPGGRAVGLIAKIERAEALASIGGIVRAADGIMVARGDLGIEVPLERLALEQKRLIREANAAGRFVIVATQMLLSMTRSPRPTRAEATDVANAVLDGTDAVMLSEESAVGEFPFEAVRWLDRIALATEAAYDPRSLRDRLAGEDESAPGASHERSVAAAAVHLAEGVRARAIVTPTHSGRTAQLVAGLRPACPVLALSGVPGTRRRLSLVRGVEARPTPLHANLEQLRREAVRLVLASGFRGRGPIVLTAGYPVEGRPTNLVTLVDVADSVRARPGRGAAPAPQGPASRARPR